MWTRKIVKLSKTALITGAAQGIGLATSHKFSQNGYQVLMLDRDRSTLDEKVKEVNGAKALHFDISTPEAAQYVVKTMLNSCDGLKALVNNAGVAEFSDLERTSVQSWRRVMDTNLDGMFYLSQALIPHLKKARGSIVNIASISGLRASTLRVAYGTSKAAVMQLSKQQAVELGEYGIRVNCVAPGPVRTKLAMAVHTKDIIDAYHDVIPLNRYGREEEIASAIYFLASDEASFITGQVLSVDGGFEATGVGLPAIRK